MQIVHAADLPWLEREEKHREGSLAFKNLFRGDEGDHNNFRWVLSRNSGTYRSPHHRHNFDQVRFCVEGTANIAPGKTLNQGDVGYFPEGTPYGPQEDLHSHRLTLVLQGGGASGLGSFSGGRFRRHGESETRDSYEAIWEHVFGRPIAYPPQRYDQPILIRTASFAWRCDGNASRKLFGSFTERGTRLEMLRIEPGERAMLGEVGATTLAFAVSGSGRHNGERWSTHSALRLAPGETVNLEGDEAEELFVITLPTIMVPSAS